MAYALVDDGFYDHPKILGLLDHPRGLEAVGLWTLTLSWAKRQVNLDKLAEAGRLSPGLIRRLGGDEELAGVLVLHRLWDGLEGGYVIHDFAFWQQLEQWKAKSAQARNAAAKRWGNAEPLPLGNADGMPTSPHLTSVTKPPKPPSPAPAVAAMFDEFYRAYPRHVAPGAARKAYDKALKRATPETILAGALRYRADPNRSDEFTKHPSTWLNQDCWGDDPLPVRGGQSRDDGGTGTGTYAPYKPF